MPGGTPRILGELKKLGVSVNRSTVVNILEEVGVDPCPQRGEPTGAEFLRMHAATVRQCDFFSHKVLTLRGWLEVFVLAFIHLDSRRVFVTPGTQHPDAEWVEE